ncbi:hypothetical protein T4B_6751 [Trichinella pseudospiralis]|uniref:Uncharacterized protein n=1 Tax=Trichinella pseudospiralis TaxID=6337 RepID=A0A0V1JSV3_TRIPS|nr:hypothetical protein T4A_10428 [Trichinella pseudospiralis]KRZ05265.1 hypothetical protein T4B_6751 [Trichinella pseudospiralis]KRZ38034.1 hypothetical protein T4C_3411 [Trichinella pseudospiralis]
MEKSVFNWELVGKNYDDVIEMKSVKVQSSSNNRLLLCNSDNIIVNVKIDKSNCSKQANSSNDRKSDDDDAIGQRQSVNFQEKKSKSNPASDFSNVLVVKFMKKEKYTAKNKKDLLHLVMDVKGTDKKRTLQLVPSNVTYIVYVKFGHLRNVSALQSDVALQSKTIR